ncbi:unnamed protein product [Anisakis simplex]|uniref:Anoctamin n=1 Tax=Anisakis simplex TaxID=6269 RepID=A0A0M3K1Q2_ANISI|nr:unnamed protein product [Anisakis simplex]
MLVAMNVKNEIDDFMAWEAAGNEETTLTCAQLFLSPKALLWSALCIALLNIISLVVSYFMLFFLKYY